MKRAVLTPEAIRKRMRERLKRQALRIIRRTKQAAATSDIPLSEWEDDFLGSVEGRLRTYGRAFSDPEKGAGGAAFSVQQTRKLKEIQAKAKGEAPPSRRRRAKAEDAT